MPEEKTVLEAAKALGLDVVIPAVYAELLSPAARELGDGLTTIAKAVKISLAPLEVAVWGYDRIRDWLSLRVTSLLAERHAKAIQTPPLSVAGPLMVQMLFTSEEPDLREMYAKLLATAMDSATSEVAHPSFVTLIQQLTPDEARILRHLASLNEKWPYWRGDQESGELESAMRKMCAEAGIADTVKADLYVENLLRLRILRRFTSSESEYHPEGGNRYGTYGASISTYNSEFIEITCYGRALLEACVIDVVAHDNGTAS